MSLRTTNSLLEEIVADQGERIRRLEARIRGDSARAVRTAGNLTLNSTAWANADTGLDLSLKATVGDVVEISVGGWFGGEAVYACLDAVSVVAAAPVNHFSGAGGATGQGFGAWKSNNTTELPIGGVLQYTLLAGDLENGQVLIRLRYRTLSAANKTLQAAADFPLHFSAKNIRPEV